MCREQMRECFMEQAPLPTCPGKGKKPDINLTSPLALSSTRMCFVWSGSSSLVKPMRFSSQCTSPGALPIRDASVKTKAPTRRTQVAFMVLARLLCFVVAFTFGTSSMAQITSPISAGNLPPKVGRITSLPVPRYVSLKAKKANVRRGPGLSYRIDWVFQRRNIPLQITAEYGHWRRVVDHEGEGGWVHYALLSGARTVIVIKDSLSLRTKPSGTAPVRAELEHNVIAWLGDCQSTWCELTAGGYTGWAHRAAIWGASPRPGKY